MIKESINMASVGDVIKWCDHYLLCKEKGVSSFLEALHSCEGCYYLGWGRCIKPLDFPSCISSCRSDGKSVIFQDINDDKGLLLVKDIEVLERLSKEYPGKTLENIQMQLQARFKELNK